MLMYLAAIDAPEDRSKFEKVYLVYKGLMYHVAYQILGNEQDAEDAVHNAFVKIAEYIEKIGDPVSSKTRNYVVTIAERKAIDLYRANQRRGKVTYLDEAGGITVDAPELPMLEYCILKLPPQYRQVILLKYYHGFSCKEIAKQLGISEANVQKLDQRAKKKLLDLCREEELL